ncbi:hypothetical protein EV127DRAFT_505844 [Xylaria flabelliformis]|nr:hypothetical protein EV127DRAFT_505844 [Xylaria flabelliformis]
MYCAEKAPIHMRCISRILLCCCCCWLLVLLQVCIYIRLMRSIIRPDPTHPSLQPLPATRTPPTCAHVLRVSRAVVSRTAGHTDLISTYDDGHDVSTATAAAYTHIRQPNTLFTRHPPSRYRARCVQYYPYYPPERLLHSRGSAGANRGMQATNYYIKSATTLGYLHPSHVTSRWDEFGLQIPLAAHPVGQTWLARPCCA